jgi:SAM-dependent methyltransferase
LNDEPPVLDPEDTGRVIRRYQQRIAEHGPTLASLNSGDAEKQRIRHRVHASAIQGERPSVFDIGCGLGALYEYLKGEDRSCEYTGYDIVPEYIEYCRARFPECRFELRNIFSDGIGSEFDTIVISQAFNNRYQASDNIQVMQAALSEAFARTRVSVSVDMLSSYVDFQAPDLFYYSPEQMFSFARTLTRRVVLRHDYLPFEFCIQLFHDEKKRD